MSGPTEHDEARPSLEGRLGKRVLLTGRLETRISLTGRIANFTPVVIGGPTLDFSDPGNSQYLWLLWDELILWG